jgi:predicted nucleotidyltransferase
VAEGAVLGVARAYVARLRESGVAVAAAYLHGPAATGPVGDYDAIDVLVVGEAFGADRVAETRMLFRAAWDVDPRVSPTPVPLSKWNDPDDDPGIWWAKKTVTEITSDGRPSERSEES